VLGKVLGLFTVVLLFVGPPACLDEEGPDRFDTVGSCYEGDLQGCLCGRTGSATSGIQFCDTSGRFSGACRCNGCTAFPDCTACSGSCLDRCLCETVGKLTECRTRCAKDGGS
jgi:hypothetical protein